jgi:hypothetical protein
VLIGKNLEEKNDKLKQALAKHKSLAGVETNEEQQVETQDFQKVEKPGFLGTFIGFIKVRLLGMSDPAYEKYILIKDIENKLKLLPIQIYNPRTYKVTRKFGKLLFELYRYLAPLKSLINIQQSKNSLAKTKEYFVKYFLNDKHKQLYNELTGEGIQELLQKEGMKNSTNLINEKYKELQQNIDKEITRKINLNFSVLHSIDDLLRYDLYPVVKKFCPGLQENIITDPPEFKDVDGDIVSDNIKDLCFVLYSVNTTYDMREPFKIFSEMKGSTIISDDDIKSFQLLLRRIVNEEYLPLLIRIIDENPFFRPVYNFTEHNIVNDFFTELANDIKNSRDNVVDKMKENKINLILSKLFNTSNFETLKNYNFEKSDILYKKGAKSFTLCRPLNCLKMFIKEIYNKYILDITNKVLIESNFADKVFNQKLSVGFLDSNDLMDQIIKFDEEYIGNEKVWGRIKGLLPNVMREQKLLVLVNKEVEEINTQADLILKKAINSYAAILECYKVIVDEYKNSSQNIITNLKTIGGGLTENKEFIETIVKAYNETQAIFALLRFLAAN